MNSFLIKCDTIISLHEKGYTEDFVTTGVNLFWIQQKMHIHAKDIAITERYRFSFSYRKKLIISGVVINRYSVKGILINYSNEKNKSFVIPPRSHKASMLP